jgi:hypothetical protein
MDKNEIQRLAKFVKEYVSHALWDACDEEGDDDKLLSDTHTVEDIEEGTLGEMEEACDEFRKSLSPELRKLVDERPEVAGPHFYLARNGMAEGFNDEEWPGVGAELRKAAAEFGPSELWLNNEDGQFYAR